jgi:protein-glucosylgalactosylhydroxylysine glucosidase
MKPISPSPEVGPRNGSRPAYVSNGVVGLRVREIPLIAGMAIVSGFAGDHPDRRIESAVAAPYPLAADIAINGVWLSDQPWAVTDLKQAYDFGVGELTSTFAFSAGSARVAVEVLTFASRTAPSIVLQRVTVSASGMMTLGLRALIDTSGIRGRLSERRTDTPGEDQPACDGVILWESEGGLSRCGLALTSAVTPNSEREVLPEDRHGPLSSEYSIPLDRAGSVVLTQTAALVPSISHARPHEEAERRVARAAQTGFDVLRERNQGAWAELWHGRITVHGASAEHQALIDAATFYLMTSTHPASPAATSIFGLASWRDYHHYFGHVMWDLEAFCVPPLILLQPGAARAMLDFRTDGLPAARRTARLSARAGLQFPWEVGPVTHEEAAPGDGSAAAHEDHVSLHVARAFALYADITGEEAFLPERAWPVLRGVADWIVSRLTRTDRGFELLRANGPAEVPDPPDNDAFTLMAAGQMLRRAIRAGEQLNQPVPPTWREVAANLYLPRRSDGVIATHDGFRIDEPKGATPSVLAGLFPYDHPLPQAERQKTLAFYLAHWRDYVGSPMLPALYPVWAAMAGDRRLALKLFEEGYAAYDRGRFHQCLEYRPDHPDSEVEAGPFFANLGGMLLGLLFGLTGIVPDDSDPQGWARRPVVLPEGWTAIEVERIWIRGRRAQLIAQQDGPSAEIRFL